MNKEEFLQSKSTKTGIPSQDLAAKWDEIEQEGISLGVDPLFDWVIYRMTRYLIKAERSPTVKGEFQPLEVDKTDYGAVRAYQEAVKKYNENKELAVKDRVVDSRGVPLFTKGFNAGKPIELSEAFQMQYNGFFKTEDGKMIKGSFKVSGKLIDKFSFRLGDVYQVAGVKNQKSTDQEIILHAQEEHQPKLVAKLSHQQHLEAVKKYYAGKIVQMQDIPSHFQTNQKNAPVLAVLRADVYSYRESRDSVENGVTIEKNNMLELMDTVSGTTITCWVPKCPELKFDFRDDTMGLVVVGTLRETKDKETQKTEYQFGKVMALYAPEAFLKPVNVPSMKDLQDVEVDAFVK